MVLRIFLCVVLVEVVTSAQSDGHATSRALNRALGVECAHCHSDRPADGERPALAVARRMMTMVDEINATTLAPVSGRISCWTCHAGQLAPARLPRDAREKALASWPSNVAAAADEVTLRMAVYTASTGRTCAGCHEDGGAGPANEEATALVTLMRSLFPVMEKYLPTQARTECFLCHKGRPHPLVAPGQ